MLSAITLVLIAAPVAVAAPADSGTVPNGVSAGGVDLSGLTLQQASDKLTADLEPHVTRELVVRAAGKRATLAQKESGLELDALTTAKRAIRSKVAGPVPVKLTYSAKSVTAFVDSLAAKTDRPARDATMRITLRKITTRRSVYGVTIPRDSVYRSLKKRLTTPGTSRLVQVKVKKVRAAINTNDLRERKGGTVITIDKRNFKLRLFKKLKFAKSYGVAIGQPAYPTPEGLFSIQNKQIDPVWSVPNSAWAGELAGTTVSGGSASNPLKARWMGITDGVGIHGTGQEWSVGTAASHGCLRMRVADVKALYPRVPVGTPVLIR
jgi:lipoprotein-anchoring transpeptidase ErfK/SrfK